MKKIGFIQCILSLCHDPSRDYWDAQKRRTCAICLLTPIPFISIFFIINLMTGNVLRGLMLLMMVSSMIGGFILLRVIQRSIMVFRTTSAIIGFFLIYFIILDNVVGPIGASFFTLIYPIFTCFLLGKREGILWCGCFLFISFPFLLLPHKVLGATPPDFDFTVRFIISFILMSIISNTFESLRQKYQDMMLREQKQLHSEISERKRTEVELQKNENLFRKLFEESNDSVLIHQGGKIINVNQSTCDLCGYSNLTS